jgi:hypothetical protein
VAATEAVRKRSRFAELPRDTNGRVPACAAFLDSSARLPDNWTIRDDGSEAAKSSGDPEELLTVGSFFDFGSN